MAEIVKIVKPIVIIMMLCLNKLRWQYQLTNGGSLKNEATDRGLI